MSYNPVIGQAVGIELEVVNQTEANIRRLLERSGSLRGWACHHDGSTQQQGYTVRGLDVNFRNWEVTHKGGREKIAVPVQTGAEVVSPIIDTTKTMWRDQIEYLCDWLRTTAHELPGTFTSTHVHVSAGGLPLYVLKNLLRIWRFLEAPIFRLSCAELGYHRGTVRKEYAYCRPLSSPLVVFDQNGALRPSFSVTNLLKAETLDDFFLGYGATDPQREPIRYHPARYCAFNLLPLLTLGTVELRTPNETVDPRNIITWVELAKALLNTAISTKGLSDDDYPQLPLGYKGDFDLGMMQTLLELPDSIMANIDRLWNMAGWQDFDGIALVNSNNENLSLSWNRLNVPTVPDAISGQSVMMYARASSGRNSEDHVYVFHDMRSYRTTTSNSPVSVERGRALVRENFQPETNADQPVESQVDRRTGQSNSRERVRFAPASNISDDQLRDLYERIRNANEVRFAATSTDSTAINGTVTTGSASWEVPPSMVQPSDVIGQFEPLTFDPPEPEDDEDDDFDRDDDDDNDEEDN